MYIAVSGNIGSGKTSLVEILSSRLNIAPYYENIDNPYLEDFYDDMSRWSFNLQISFLANKIEQLNDITHRSKDVIQDRTIYEEAYIFVANLKEMGLLSGRDHNTYLDIFNLMVRNIPMPDVIIYLKASVPTLLGQIYKRGRAYEMRIEPDYLNSLNILYENWITNIYKGKVIVIDIDKDDFIITPDIIDTLIEQLSPYLTEHNNTENHGE